MAKIRKELVFGILVISIVTIGVLLQFLINTKTPNDPNNDGTDNQSMSSNLLQFRIDDGDIQNEFFRNESISAHVLLRSGLEPRFIAAFPAGNSGTGIWFEKLDETAVFNFTESLTGMNDTFGDLKLFGVCGKFEIKSNNDLIIKKVILSSIRVLRNYDSYQSYPSLEIHETTQDNTISWVHLRCDGKSAYLLQLNITHGQIIKDSSDNWHLVPSEQSNFMEVSFKVLTGEIPLSPFSSNEIFHPDFDSNYTELKNVLSFLTYNEKMLAGSWRFLTYFGRDTLISLKLLMNVLSPTVIEAGIRSVLERLNENGEVAHEEDIGEFALIRHDNCYNDNPIFDYKMVDDDFLLAPIVADYLLNSSEGKNRAEAFLSSNINDKTTYLDAILSNFQFIHQKTYQFTQNPIIENLVPLQPGKSVGDWRDSSNGLGGGRYSYSVNVGLIPSALDAIERLIDSGLLTKENTFFLDDIPTIAKIWNEKAHSLFQLNLSRELGRTRVENYGNFISVPSINASNSIQDEISFYALSLREDGSPVPILHSDVGFNLLYSKPSPKQLDTIISSIFRPFPAGLLTPIGLVVSNPVFDETTLLWEDFSRNAYHGSVIWSWQQVLLAAGLDHQIQRKDLDQVLIDRLNVCKQDVLDTILKTRSTWSSELWSWEYSNDVFVLAPYGQLSGHITESNAAQLWSTVYLALNLN